MLALLFFSFFAGKSCTLIITTIFILKHLSFSSNCVATLSMVAMVAMVVDQFVPITFTNFFYLDSFFFFLLFSRFPIYNKLHYYKNRSYFHLFTLIALKNAIHSYSSLCSARISNKRLM